MYICICKAVTDREIRQAAELGANSLSELQECLGVATCCGKCAQETCRILHEQKQACCRDMQVNLPSQALALVRAA